jgi:hypothetical protein
MGKWEDDGIWTGPDPTVAELFDEDEEMECQCCGSKGVPLKAFLAGTDGIWREQARRGKDAPFRALCSLCAGTMTSVWADYPKQHDYEITEMMKTICFVGNSILKEIRQGRRP